MTGSGRKDIGGALTNWLLKFGSRLRMEELHRLREIAEGKSQSASLTHVEKSPIPAPSIEIARVAHFANDDSPHSECTSTDQMHADPRVPVVHAAITDTPLRTPPCALWTPPTPLHTAQRTTDSDPAAADLPSDATRFTDAMA